MKTKKRKETEIDEELENEIEEDSTGDDDKMFDGFPEDGLLVHVYRQQANKKEEFLDVLSSPVSPLDIKSKFGGGTFMCYVKDEKNRIVKKRMLSIAKDNSQPTAQPVAQQSAGLSSGLGDLAQIIEIVGKLSENKATQSEQMSKMMEMMSTGMMTMMTTSMTMMSSNMEMMKKASEMVAEKSEGGSGTIGMITDTIKEVSKTIGSYLAMRKPTIAPRTIKQNPRPVIIPQNPDAVTVEPEKKADGVPAVTLVDVINTSYIRDPNDLDFVVDYVEKIYPELYDNIVNIPVELIYKELTGQGLSVPEGWFNELYQYFKDSGDDDSETSRSRGNIPDGSSHEENPRQVQGESHNPDDRDVDSEGGQGRDADAS